MCWGKIPWMNEENLKNLARLGHLKAEPADARECAGLLASARERLLDARVGSLSFAGRFDLAYNAAHAAALTALRRAGYRTDKRYFVFQCLGSTSSLSKTDIRILALCHGAGISPNTRDTSMRTKRCWPLC